MYGETGKSFTQVLESFDPSEEYRGTALEGLDAYQRQLKRFDIKVRGAGSDMLTAMSRDCTATANYLRSYAERREALERRRRKKA